MTKNNTINKELEDCIANYGSNIVRNIFGYLLDTIGHNYKLNDCNINKNERDLYFYSLLILTVLVALILILLLIYFVKKCCSSQKHVTPRHESIMGPKIPDLNTNNQFNLESNENNNNRRLEMMEFYRRLLINQMVKREKFEETYLEKFGNLLRDGVNCLFGDPRKGLDLTDPLAIFYPYWPDRKDYNILNAYSALNDHMQEENATNLKIGKISKKS